MAYNQKDYSFTKTVNKNGTLTRWYSVLTYLYEEGPAKKTDIISYIYDVDEFYNLSYEQYGIFPAKVPGTEFFDLKHDTPHTNRIDRVTRGYCSHMFACMRSAGLVDYDKSTRLWSITEKGKTMVNDKANATKKPAKKTNTKPQIKVLNSQMNKKESADFKVMNDGNTQVIIPLHPQVAPAPSVAKTTPDLSGFVENIIGMINQQVSILCDLDKRTITDTDKSALIAMQLYIENTYEQLTGKTIS